MVGNPLERINQFEESLAVAIDALGARLWCNLPGEIISFDPVKQTASVQVTIQFQARQPDGSTAALNMPPLVDCPVEFPSGGGFTLTFPVKPGDECSVSFADRCIDAWWQSGGVQPQAEFRMHDLSDGFVRVGPRSIPKVIADISITATELRSDDGTVKITLGAAAIAMVAPSGVDINGTLFMPGGVVTTAGDVTASGKSLATHVHSGVTIGGGNTGAPV